jgi:hypothetical protein
VWGDGESRLLADDRRERLSGASLVRQGHNGAIVCAVDEREADEKTKGDKPTMALGLRVLRRAACIEGIYRRRLYRQ